MNEHTSCLRKYLAFLFLVGLCRACWYHQSGWAVVCFVLFLVCFVTVIINGKEY